jgi:Dimerisation domain
MPRHDPTSLPATQQTAARSPDIDSAAPITPERLMQLTFGFAPPLIIEAAIRHRVVDLLDEGAKALEKLCAETQTSLRGLRAILNALVGLQLLAKDDDGRYVLTPESAAFLVRGKPAFHGAFFLLTSGCATLASRTCVPWKLPGSRPCSSWRQRTTEPASQRSAAPARLTLARREQTLCATRS